MVMFSMSIFTINKHSVFIRFCINIRLSKSNANVFLISVSYDVLDSM